MENTMLNFQIDTGLLIDFKNRLTQAGSTGMSETLRSAIYQIVSMDDDNLADFLLEGKREEMKYNRNRKENSST